MASRRSLGILMLAVGSLLATAAGCFETRVCPTIGCQPQVALTYRTEISQAHQLSVTIKGMTFEASCPIQEQAVRVVGVKSCSDSGFVLTGVDLGHASNDVVQLTVAIDAGTPIDVTASLKGIINSRDCDLVCFDHEGLIAN